MKIPLRCEHRLMWTPLPWGMIRCSHLWGIMRFHKNACVHAQKDGKKCHFLSMHLFKSFYLRDLLTHSCWEISFKSVVWMYCTYYLFIENNLHFLKNSLPWQPEQMAWLSSCTSLIQLSFLGPGQWSCYQGNYCHFSTIKKRTSMNWNIYLTEHKIHLLSTLILKLKILSYNLFNI